MDLDDVIYLSLLVLIIITGPYIKNIRDGSAKQIISTLLGLAITIIVSGLQSIHPIIVTLINSAIVIVYKKNCHIISFVFCFSYLAAFRLANLFGIIVNEYHHLNAIQMLHTLKMVGLAFEMHDTYSKKEKGGHTNEYKCIEVKASFVDIVQYAFCHIGLLTGPYFSFRTYSDWLNKPYSRCANTNSMMLRRISVVPLYIAGLFIGSYFFPLNYARSEIYSDSAIYRWFYQIPLFFNFRMRLFIAFVLSECGCIANGLGIYPSITKPNVGQGPTDYEALLKLDTKDDESLKKDEYSYETIHNIDEYGAEVTTSVRLAMRTWNRSVQYWLAMFVYKRVKVFRVALTMLTSAFWHGVYSGYYLGLLTVPFVFIAEASMESAVRKHLNSTGKFIYDVLSWFFKTNMYAYMGMGFFLVHSGDTMEYWKSLYFFGHFLIVFFYVLGRLISFIRKSLTKRAASDEKKKE